MRHGLSSSYVRDERFIVERDLVSGGFDYVLKVPARDVDHYREIMDDMVAVEVGASDFRASSRCSRSNSREASLSD
jgi:hypothetical protein